MEDSLILSIVALCISVVLLIIVGVSTFCLWSALPGASDLEKKDQSMRELRHDVGLLSAALEQAGTIDVRLDPQTTRPVSSIDYEAILERLASETQAYDEAKHEAQIAQQRLQAARHRNIPIPVMPFAMGAIVGGGS